MIHRYATHTVHRLSAGHWLIVRRTFGGWLLEENVDGQVEVLHGPNLHRDVVELIADAYAATRSADVAAKEA